jgi:hypothetical protein
VPTSFIGPDCNGNGRNDACDILAGFSTDLNHNGVPDECDPPCAADFNGDHVLNSSDFFEFVNAFFNGDAAADFNHDMTVNSQDFFDYLTAFFAGCP